MCGGKEHSSSCAPISASFCQPCCKDRTDMKPNQRIVNHSRSLTHVEIQKNEREKEKTNMCRTPWFDLVKCKERLKVTAQKQTLKKSKLIFILLNTRENSLIISPLFFDAFAGELISLITSINSKCSSSLFTDGGLFDFFFFFYHVEASAEECWTILCNYVMRTLWLQHVNICGGACVCSGWPPIDMSVLEETVTGL